MKRIGSCAACVSAWLLFAERAPAEELVDPETDTDRAAATDEATEIDAIVVTGTHIKRIQIEGPLPISVIERDELMASGQANLADAVRDLPYNSFGSIGDVPNSDTPNTSLPNLRGLGSKYTLTLLDGHRLPGFALDGNGGAAASLTGIPLAAIDRIEVLRDGASAVYGSDAIGGVINLLTRREDTAPELEFQIEYPEQDGGETHRASFVYGRSHEHGHWLLAAEWQDREPLLGADRDYLIELAGLSQLGNPGAFIRVNPTTGRLVGSLTRDPRCPETVDSDPVFPSSGRLGANGCGYRFRDLNAERAGYEGRSLFATARHEFSESLSLLTRVLAIDGDSRTQLAPTPLSLLQIAADNPFNPTRGELGPELGYPLLMLYRLTPLGPRITEVEEQSLHSLVGIEGALDWAEGGDWGVTLSHNRYDHEAAGVAGYALRSAVQSAVNAGRFNPFAAEPNNPTGLEDAVYQTWRRSETRTTALEFAANLDAAFWFDMSASYAFGADFRRDEYGIEADPELLQGTVLGIGSYREAESSARSHGGVYGEMFLPLADRWEMNLAARYDHYQDAGGALSPKLALGFRPSESWLLRAAIGKGFQAPDLPSLNGPTVASEIQVVDQVDCYENPLDPAACRRRAAQGNLVSNEDLEPEHALQGSLGVLWQPQADIDISLDYYQTRIEDQVGSLTADDVLFLELDCQLTGRVCDPIQDGQVLRDALGNLSIVITPLINIAKVETRGLDLEVGARHHTEYGNFRLDLRASKVLDYDVEPSSFVDGYDGAEFQPSWRGTLRLDWQHGNHGLSAGVEYIASKGQCYYALLANGSPNPACEERVGSHTEIDAQWRWTAPWDGEIAIGGRNLTNRPPPHDFEGSYQYGLYDANGRVWYLRYRQVF